MPDSNQRCFKSDTADFTPGFVQFQKHTLLISVTKQEFWSPFFLLFSISNCPQHTKNSVASYILPVIL